MYNIPECPKCGGTGYVWALGVPGLRKKCDACNGTGGKSDERN